MPGVQAESIGEQRTLSKQNVRRSSVVFAVCVALGVWFVPIAVHAGDDYCWCNDVDDEAAFLRAIATGNKMTPARAIAWAGRHSTEATERCVYTLFIKCFVSTPIQGSTEWAGPNAARRFTRQHKAAYRRVLEQTCAAILSDRRAERPTGPEGWSFGHLCLRALASHGLQRVGGHEVLGLQMRFGKLTSYELAMLGDARAVDQLIEIFNAADEMCKRFRKKENASQSCHELLRVNRWQQGEHRGLRVDALNALWHLVSPRARPFLRRVIDTDTDPVIRDRAQRVLARIEELHPKSDASTD